MSDIREIAEKLTDLDRSLLLGTAEGWGSWMFDSGEYMISLGLGTKREGCISFNTPLADEARAHLTGERK